jgi:hypothetical protein
MMCEACPEEIVRGQAKGYIPEGPVHLSCVPSAETVCPLGCNLIHAGACP